MKELTQAMKDYQQKAIAGVQEMMKHLISYQEVVQRQINLNKQRGVRDDFLMSSPEVQEMIKRGLIET